MWLVSYLGALSRHGASKDVNAIDFKYDQLHLQAGFIHTVVVSELVQVEAKLEGVAQSRIKWQRAIHVYPRRLHKRAHHVSFVI